MVDEWESVTFDSKGGCTCGFVLNRRPIEAVYVELVDYSLEITSMWLVHRHVCVHMSPWTTGKVSMTAFLLPSMATSETIPTLSSMRDIVAAPYIRIRQLPAETCHKA